MTMHRDLLQLRREDPDSGRSGRAAWMGPCWVRRHSCCAFSGRTARIGCLLVNLGRDLHLNPAPEPLLAPPADKRLGNPLVERGSALRRQRHGTAGYRGELAHPGRSGRGVAVAWRTPRPSPLPEAERWETKASAYCVRGSLALSAWREPGER